MCSASLVYRDHNLGLPATNNEIGLHMTEKPVYFTIPSDIKGVTLITEIPSGSGNSTVGAAGGGGGKGQVIISYKAAPSAETSDGKPHVE